jgi:hypothetical protein
MKSYNKKNKHSSPQNSDQNSKKDFDHLNEQEKKNHNKPLNTGNHIEKKWFPRTK